MKERDETRNVQVIDRDSAETHRRVYERPVLLALGEIRTLTLGASPGAGESAGGEVRYYNPGP